VTGGRRKVHNEELRDLYSSPSIMRIIKSRMIIWERNVARIGEKRNLYRLLVGKLEGNTPLRRQDVGGWIILRLIFERWDGVMWTELVWMRIETSGMLL
jgi:hypothetical protein